MGIYVYIGRDGETALELRKTDIRERHLAHIEKLDGEGRIVYAGPLRNAGEQPCGSVIVLRAEDYESARRVAESDPYLKEGVFERIEVFGSMQVFPKQ